MGRSRGGGRGGKRRRRRKMEEEARCAAWMPACLGSSNTLAKRITTRHAPRSPTPAPSTTTGGELDLRAVLLERSGVHQAAKDAGLSWIRVWSADFTNSMNSATPPKNRRRPSPGVRRRARRRRRGEFPNVSVRRSLPISRLRKNAAPRSTNGALEVPLLFPERLRRQPRHPIPAARSFSAPHHRLFHSAGPPAFSINDGVNETRNSDACQASRTSGRSAKPAKTSTLKTHCAPAHPPRCRPGLRGVTG
eukprot:scaffold48_cov311-Pinguiococcus_pyrenoidosus.AAC.110